VAPRSGLAWKNHIDIGAGVVDEDYRGNVGKSLLTLRCIYDKGVVGVGSRQQRTTALAAVFFIHVNFVNGTEPVTNFDIVSNSNGAANLLILGCCF
jgi:hypothetical protein